MVGDSSQLWHIEKSITDPAFQNDPGSAESFLRERNRPTSIADTNREIEAYGPVLVFQQPDA